ncbi:MAG: hypothetical protein GT600_09555 [Bacteroidales bacterium]|jgi:hypothetical protein|nr:hypothetical protein [Bacteroidales bacterium]NMD03068.1 hypothetical protein [Bacteroidales bacterium]
MKKYYYILGSLQAITGIGAIPAGIGYLMDTTGQGMGTSVELLANSPLKSFLLPGLFLLLVNGLAHLVGAYLSFSRNIYAGYAGLILGISLSLWIIIQVTWISLSSVLQPLFLVIGLINTWLAWRILKTEKGKSHLKSGPEKV